MLHKFYDSQNITLVFLSPYCKILENTNYRIRIINCTTNQIVIFSGERKCMDALRKSFVLNMGMEYENLSPFFEQFDHCTADTWQELIQGGFLE